MRPLLPLAVSACIGLSATFANAACTGDLATTGFTNVFLEATGDAVIGGIGANQCGLEVTEFCEANRCLVFFEGLSGFVDIADLEEPIEGAVPLQFAYEVSAVDGTLSFMGQSQEFALTEGRPVFVEPQADHVLLRLPSPLPTAIRMTSTGSSGWEALLPDWVGVPVPVSLYLDRPSADTALLEIAADHQILKMDMRLRLTRIVEASPEQAAPAAEAVARQTACQETHALALSVGAAGDQGQIDAYFAAVSAVGIVDWDNRTESQCDALLVALAAAGIPASQPAAAPTVETTGPCTALIDQAASILSGADSAPRRALQTVMVTLAVTRFNPANPKHCAEVSYALQE
ncbi:MAG: hypothetical protein AAFP28_03650 [Pseudomonadota bacterium]